MLVNQELFANIVTPFSKSAESAETGKKNKNIFTTKWCQTSKASRAFTSGRVLPKNKRKMGATWCTITRVALVGTPVGCLLAHNRLSFSLPRPSSKHTWQRSHLTYRRRRVDKHYILNTMRREEKEEGRQSLHTLHNEKEGGEGGRVDNHYILYTTRRKEEGRQSLHTLHNEKEGEGGG